jgi:hypothetical protein
MRAFITINLKDGEPVVPNDPDSPVRGMKLPYMTRHGLPVFTLETEDPFFVGPNWLQVDAFPGMIGIAQKGDQIYCVDAEEQAQQLPFHIITHKQYERFLHLQESFKAETV